MANMTYAMALDNAIALVDAETAEKLTALKGQISKKRTSTKPTKKQVANAAEKERIVELLSEAEEGMSCKAIREILGYDSPQYTSALLTGLEKDGRVKSEVSGKVKLFTIA